MGLGTKASNLVKMRELCYNVPDFIVLPSSAYKDQIDHEVITHFYQEIDFESKLSIEMAVDKIQNYVLHHLPDFDIKIKFDLCSVRSSTNLEDGSEHSFAGQFSTYLNVPEKDVNEKIKNCLSTMYNESVLIYIHKNKLNLSDLEMNIIIQEMVEADYSGIVFTANPQGLLNEMVIVAGEGTGDNVVEDKVDVTTYFYNKSDETIYSVNQEKALKLSAEMIGQLIEVSKGLEKDFGNCLDIEFSVKNDDLYLLQVRKITSLSEDDLTILDNSNIVESYPGVCSPLTIEFAKMAYTKVFTSLMTHFLSVSENEIGQITKKMVGSNNGRMYYIISNWYELLVLLPFSKKIIPIWQEMLGVGNKEYDKGEFKLSFSRKLIRNFNFVKFIFRSDKLMQQLSLDFEQVKEYFNQSYSSSLSNEELIEMYHQLDQLLSSWYVTLINDMYAFVYTGLLKRYLKAIRVKDYELICNELIRNGENLESMLPLIELSKIVSHIQENKLEDELSSLSSDTVTHYLSANDTALKSLINNYIDRYGDRYLAELKLENETFRTTPYLLITSLLNYCENPLSLKKRSDDRELKLNFISKHIVKFLQKRAIIGIEHRESSRLNRARIFGMVRTIVSTMGENFEKAGELTKAKDIFYLTPSEIVENAISKEKIEARKKQNAMYELIPPYSRLVFSSQPFNKQHTNIDGFSLKQGDEELCGIPSSSGYVEGEVVVISQLDHINEIPSGKILVTKMTDPGWVFLLTSSIAVISEKGSLLSHTAIISRELGIPAIVGVDNVTRILKTGDHISMDGTTGEIKIKAKNNV